MIDTDKYEGHTPGPWYAEEEEVEEGKAWTVRGGDHWAVMESDGCLRIDWKKEDALLAADAPRLLERVIHLEHILKCAKDVLTNLYTYDKDLEDAQWIAWFCDMEEE
jgi:hypothetical protein|tara:strand:- start:38 stop:358 length:321 start_codon:yes stop_codon:yes gene_type:complete